MADQGFLNLENQSVPHENITAHHTTRDVWIADLGPRATSSPPLSALC